MTADGNATLPGRPFEVLGIHHVAIGAADKSSLTRLWIELLGLTRTGEYRSAAENVDEVIVRAGAGRQLCEIDLMQPVDPDAKPRVHEPALNHVGLWVDDLAAAYDWLSTNGVRLAAGGIRKGAAGHDVCFIHPRGDERSPLGGEGVLIELVQAPADVIEALGRTG